MSNQALLAEMAGVLAIQGYREVKAARLQNTGQTDPTKTVLPSPHVFVSTAVVYSGLLLIDTFASTLAVALGAGFLISIAFNWFNAQLPIPTIKHPGRQ